MACLAVVLIEPERIPSMQEALVIDHVNQHVMFTEFIIYNYDTDGCIRIYMYTYLHIHKPHVLLVYVGLTQAHPNE